MTTEHLDFRLPSNFTLERAEGQGELGEPRPIKFRATLARRDVVDSDGLLVQPDAIAEQKGDAVPLIRYHGKDPSSGLTSMGAGHIRVERDEAWVEGELHNTAAAREFADELEGLQRFGLGEASAGGGIVTKSLRRPQGLERDLGAKAVVGQAVVREVSFCTTGKLPGSNLELVRSLLPADEQGDGTMTTADVELNVDGGNVTGLFELLRSQSEALVETNKVLRDLVLARHDVDEDADSRDAEETNDEAAEDAAEADSGAEAEAPESEAAPENAPPPETSAPVVPEVQPVLTSEQMERAKALSDYLQTANRLPLRTAAAVGGQNGA